MPLESQNIPSKAASKLLQHKIHKRMKNVITTPFGNKMSKAKEGHQTNNKRIHPITGWSRYSSIYRRRAEPTLKWMTNATRNNQIILLKLSETFTRINFQQPKRLTVFCVVMLGHNKYKIVKQSHSYQRWYSGHKNSAPLWAEPCFWLLGNRFLDGGGA